MPILECRMNKLFKALVALKLAALVFCISPAAPYLSNINDGFAIGKISAPLPKSEDFIPLNREALSALSQRYTYLGKGAQTYAFLSQDGAYVLKLFKGQHLTPAFWSSYLPPSWQEKSLLRKKERLEALFNSYQVASERLSQETGLLCVHLSATAGFDRQVTVQDLIGHEYRLNLDDFAFVLQERATLIGEVIDHLIQSGRSEEVLALIDAATACVSSRLEKGYIDTDPAFLQNYGVTASGKVIQIDVGRLVKDNLAGQDRVSIETAQLMQFCAKRIGRNRTI